MASDCDLIFRYCGIDIADPTVRQRAWQRIQVFRTIIAECEEDDNPTTAAWLRGIVWKAVIEQDAVCLAILAGLNRTDASDSDA